MIWLGNGDSGQVIKGVELAFGYVLHKAWSESFAFLSTALDGCSLCYSRIPPWLRA